MPDVVAPQRPLVRWQGQLLQGRPRPRLRPRRGNPLAQLRFAVAAVRPEAEAFRLEAACIALLRPTAQAVRRDTPVLRARRPRPWPRFRQRPPIPREQALNVHTRLRTEPRAFARLTLAQHTLESLVAHLRRRHGLSEKGFLRRLYDRGREPWLALVLGEPGTHFDYKRVWRQPRGGTHHRHCVPSGAAYR